MAPDHEAAAVDEYTELTVEQSCKRATTTESDDWGRGSGHLNAVVTGAQVDQEATGTARTLLQ